MRTILILLTLVPLTFLSCGTTNNKTMTEEKSEPNQELFDTFWVLETLNEEHITHPADPREIGLTLSSEENRVSGFGGCNTFMGSFSLKDSDKIEFSKIASTKMACLQTTFDENRLFRALESIDNYILSVDNLILKSGNKTIATLKKSSKQEKEIVEKYWKLKSLAGKEVVMGENQEQEVHFILKDHNKTISGYDGCNSFSGEFEMNDGNQFTTSRMRSTLRICPDSDFDEMKFNSLFIGPVTYEVNGDVLIISNNNTDFTAEFEAVYFD